MCQRCVAYSLHEPFGFGSANAFLVTQQAFASSGNSAIDALMGDATWTGGTGSSATITYSFDSVPSGAAFFTAQEEAMTRLALQEWSKVANVTFTEISGSGTADMYFSRDELGSGVAGLTTSYFFGAQLDSADVQIDNGLAASFGVGSFEYLVLLHEIGHALGLKHPGNYSGSEDGPFLSAALDNVQNTVMSYNDGVIADSLLYPPVTPMIFDIAAIQYMYGANSATNSGNNAYFFGSFGGGARTIWDGGGTDTLIAYNVSGNHEIRLGETYNQYSLVGNDTVWIAAGANIENVIAGNGSDQVYGNPLNNHLYGHNSSDLIAAGLGNDLLIGGEGPTDGVDGNDTMLGGGGNDILYGNAGSDVIYGGAGSSDSTDGGDVIYGGLGDDVIYGNAGGDTIDGGPGNDSIYGGLGNDIFRFGNSSGSDVLYGFDNPGATAGDRIQITANLNGTTIDTIAEVLAATSYSGGNASIALGSGSIIIVSVAANSLTADDFSII